MHKLGLRLSELPKSKAPFLYLWDGVTLYLWAVVQLTHYTAERRHNTKGKSSYFSTNIQANQLYLL
jgi:hypothetical protein